MSYFTKYAAAKAADPGTMIFVIIGEFIETFGADAELFAKITGTNVVSTYTEAHKVTSMAGAIVTVAEPYLEKVAQRMPVACAL